MDVAQNGLSNLVLGNTVKKQIVIFKCKEKFYAVDCGARTEKNAATMVAFVIATCALIQSAHAETRTKDPFHLFNPPQLHRIDSIFR